MKQNITLSPFSFSPHSRPHLCPSSCLSTSCLSVCLLPVSVCTGHIVLFSNRKRRKESHPEWPLVQRGLSPGNISSKDRKWTEAGSGQRQEVDKDRWTEKVKKRKEKERRRKHHLCSLSSTTADCVCVCVCYLGSRRWGHWC